MDIIRITFERGSIIATIFSKDTKKKLFSVSKYIQRNSHKFDIIVKNKFNKIVRLPISKTEIVKDNTTKINNSNNNFEEKNNIEEEINDITNSLNILGINKNTSYENSNKINTDKDMKLVFLNHLIYLHYCQFLLQF